MKIKESQCPERARITSPALKARFAIEAIKDHKTTAYITEMFGVYPTPVAGWKKPALAGLPVVLGNDRDQMRQQANTERTSLYQHIGQLNVE